LIDLALKENSPEREQQREVFARSHTWEANTNEIFKRIEMIEKTK